MKDFLNTLYNSLYHMKESERNHILFQLFGWDGHDALMYLKDARLKEYDE